jgi:IS5 family transposase
MKKYYTANFLAKPEVIEGYGGLLTPYAREVLQSIFSISKEELKEELSKIPEEEVEAFCKSSKRIKVYVDETINRKWLAIQRRYKKQAQYLINQMLLEKLKEVDI